MIPFEKCDKSRHEIGNEIIKYSDPGLRHGHTNIKKTVLLSEHVNLLTTEMKPKTADQKMPDFEVQINLTEREQ
ncbi:hypothetical protein BDBG_16817 [Blastomyces gilchristii SLH14081]|uniref:Uncharacterized protein n=1 Tax=Blastomyces gilchristii (strain SLH14081) TaxID=559298 RepID=A0A179ULN5_BLAGS|nr:uncharacterized protein BDBG_16817 [Blastomyces gilchristii SLH14081]OAT07322.1 hypothetical protein BDBG_16817 [Blastomyces gilchristii SLH14081]